MVEEKFTRILKPKYFPFWELEQESRPKTAPTLATEGQRERFQELGPKRPKQTPSGTGFVSNNTIQGCNCSRICSCTQVLSECNFPLYSNMPSSQASNFYTRGISAFR